MSPDRALQIGNGLACMAKSLAELADELKAEYDFDHEAEPEAPEDDDATETKVPDYLEVRALLTESARDGHTDEIHALLEKHGVNKLSALPPSEYAAIMAEVRAIQ